MSNKDLIPIDNSRPNKKKQKKHLFFKLICYFLVLALGYYAYLNLDNIKAYFDEHKMPSQNEQSNDKEITDTEKPQGGSSENNDNKVENTVNIPKDAYIINSVTGSFSEINNESSIEIEADLSNETIPKIGDTYEKYGKDAPHILIIHSNCNEAYSNGRYYFTSDSFYSSKSNVGDVGKIICDTLNENHINAIHIDDIFGSGGIFHSRKELESAINEALKKYPSIKIVLDVSRGININDDLSMDKMVVEANGKNAAQISITVGSDNESGIIYSKNLNFANALQDLGGNLIYDITVAPFKLSQDIEPIFLKIDVGSYANTFDEAMQSGYELALVIFGALS